MDIAKRTLGWATLATILLFFNALPIFTFVLMMNKPSDEQYASQTKNEQQQLYCGTLVWKHVSFLVLKYRASKTGASEIIRNNPYIFRVDAEARGDNPNTHGTIDLDTSLVEKTFASALASAIRAQEGGRDYCTCPNRKPLEMMRKRSGLRRGSRPKPQKHKSPAFAGLLFESWRETRPTKGFSFEHFMLNQAAPGRLNGLK